MGAEEINAFLTHLAVDRNVSASTQNQALSAILFFYREVLGENVGWIADIVKATRPRRMPVVFTRDEVVRILGYSARILSRRGRRFRLHVSWNAKPHFETRRMYEQTRKCALSFWQMRRGEDVFAPLEGFKHEAIGELIVS